MGVCGDSWPRNGSLNSGTARRQAGQEHTLSWCFRTCQYIDTHIDTQTRTQTDTHTYTQLHAHRDVVTASTGLQSIRLIDG